MPYFNVKKHSDIDKTFRVAKIMADYDVKQEHSDEKFEGKITFPDEWNIGAIVGGSGTGKTTIARELFPTEYINKFNYKAKSVIDDMPKQCTVVDIEKMFYAVGFGSVPSWLKPYSILSNGEKMRVDLARSLLEKDFVVFDEFTSVVDRNVAKTCCIAVNKAIHKTNKKFIAVSCHSDILEYLQPDWVFDTNTMTQVFQYAHGLKKDTLSDSATKASGQNLDVIII